MPQMKPLNWMFLYLSFNTIILLINVLNFYMINNSPYLNNKNNLNKTIYNWKW